MEREGPFTVVEKNVIYYDKTEHANFWCKPLFSSYKTTLIQHFNGEKKIQM